MRLTSLLLSKIPKRYAYANFPERFIKKQTDFVEWRTPPYPNYQPRTVRYRKQPYYDIHRPWTTEPMRNFPVFVGDTVAVLRGKDKGKRGTVSYVVAERNWVCVRNLNLEYSMTQRERRFPGVINTIERPLLLPRDVSLVDPEDNEPDGGGKAFETRDYKVKLGYAEQAKDTPAAEVTRVTFEPALKTFEMEIAEAKGIKEDRVPYPMYWY
ncbi:39S ribosomal protein L24, mitochondrial [Tyrophagus putrescentiae]|nr:39S ribosomal protein L24, mitochondrial [Tyrophagus putrescentiae]